MKDGNSNSPCRQRRLSDSIVVAPQRKQSALHFGISIRAGLLRDQPPHHFTSANLLAMLTSARRDERDDSKRMVRNRVRAGAQILAAEKAAQDLADFANRNEP
ncbi:MAG: hypothetical protein Q8M11_16315 [Sulfuritalea sp.]|nr:hypothetical protein [Sulfuritalea sp.]MDP1983794.1 hypothetical protein [Sulfuritalea sp.]